MCGAGGDTLAGQHVIYMAWPAQDDTQAAFGCGRNFTEGSPPRDDPVGFSVKSIKERQ